MTDKKLIKFGDVFNEVRITSKDPLQEGLKYYIGLEHLDTESLKIRRFGKLGGKSPNFQKVFRKGQILLGKR
ncbi:hypothetical protein [Marinobacter sp.]|uniref:hypothetical protein n=1 Tax=Marinobacter sp. TaxID=50741 RepID=UPI000C651F23|nr:hypothetical protein [Marinobacter sp.]MBE93558.1 hypothetical protein [Marinobacter sp.]|tara:strand:- start:252 stop:467 length:216 start_codon:yes stop_codon:yes gene_type:complete